MSAPIFVVGLPRSGSTLLSRVLNESADILSVNDLYYLQAVLAQNATGETLAPDMAAHLLDALLEVLITRGSVNTKFIGQFELSSAQAADIREAVLELAQAGGLDWAGLMDQTLSRAAALVGKSRWADKTPQNFMHMDLLRQAFPEAKFIFLLRDPRSTLASFKFASGPGHDRRRYHPKIYALYWRTAARALVREQERDDVMVLRFEDLKGNVAGVSKLLGEFLGTEIPAVDLTMVGDNSSFKGRARQPLTSTETWMVQRTCNAEMVELGYKLEPASHCLADVPEMLWLTLRCGVFQLARLLFSRNARKRIITLAGRILRPS